MKPDLDTPENIKAFVDSFYAKVLSDTVLKPIFIDVIGIDIKVHKPLICQYWEKLLLGSKEYKRHTMNIHRDIHDKIPLSASDFERWLQLFKETAEFEFDGPLTDRAVEIATSIAGNMNKTLNEGI